MKRVGVGKQCCTAGGSPDVTQSSGKSAAAAADVSPPLQGWVSNASHMSPARTAETSAGKDVQSCPRNSISFGSVHSPEVVGYPRPPLRGRRGENWVTLATIDYLLLPWLAHHPSGSGNGAVRLRGFFRNLELLLRPILPCHRFSGACRFRQTGRAPYTSFQG
jgi:hypothetical protein